MNDIQDTLVCRVAITMFREDLISFGRDFIPTGGIGTFLLSQEVLFMAGRPE